MKHFNWNTIGLLVVGHCEQLKYEIELIHFLLSFVVDFGICFSCHFQDRYWCLSNGAGIQADGNRRCADALFEMVWHGDGSVSFRANNGKFLATKRSGHLFSTSESIEEITKFYFYLINRPILVLKCEQGFVGLRSQSTTKLECNKATYETILVERSNKGVVYFKGMFVSHHLDDE